MKILLLLLALGFLTQLWSAVIRGRNRGETAKRIGKAAVIWVPLVGLVALAAFTRKDWTVLVAGVLAVYVGMIFWYRWKRVSPPLPGSREADESRRGR